MIGLLFRADEEKGGGGSEGLFLLLSFLPFFKLGR